jgi:hypothetical protein
MLGSIQQRILGAQVDAVIVCGAGRRYRSLSRPSAAASVRDRVQPNASAS